MSPSVPVVTPFFKASFNPRPASSWERGLDSANFALMSATFVGRETGGKAILQPETRAIRKVEATILNACILQR